MQTNSAYTRLIGTLGPELSLAPQRWEQCLTWASGEVAFTPMQTSNSASGCQVIRVRGALSQHYSDWAVSTDLLGKLFDQAMASSVAAIVFDVDSPGGSVSGTQILADKIYRARGNGKRIITLANSMMASAAFWAFSAADEIYAAPNADVGAVGVWSAHEDVSKMLEKMGVRITTVSSGKFKTEGAPWAELTAEARGEMQRRCDMFARDFHHAVARHRSTTAANVANTYGEGRLVEARSAVNRGMVDGVSSLDQLLLRYGAIPPSKNRSARAAYLSEQMQMEREARVAYLLDVERSDRLRALESYKIRNN